MKTVRLEYNYSMIRLSEIIAWHKSNNILINGYPIFEGKSIYEYGYLFCNDEDATAFIMRFG